MNKCKFIQPINPQIRFGVELKELYPPWYLHPTLKNLIYLAEVNIRNRHSVRFDVEQLLGKGCNGEGSVKQRLDLKERMISGRNILEVDVATGVPIWLIRHFLGLLPTPIFPPKCDEHYWYNFSIRWYEQFIESVKRRSAPIELKDAVAFELSHLPGRNLTFLFELFELIRFLSMKSMSDDVVDKHAALLLVKYYTPSLFVRPYRPGNFTKNDKKYFAFILFAVHFWPDLRIRIHDKLTSSMNKDPVKFYYYPEKYDHKYSDNNIYHKDIGTQTESETNSDLLLDIQSSSEDYSDNNQNTKSKNKYLHDKLEELMSITNNQTSQNDFTSLEFQEDRKVVSSTPKTKERQPSALIKNISQKNIDEYYELIKKSNCKFLKSISTQTDTPVKKEIACDTLKPNPKFSVKTNSKIKTRFNKKKNNIRDIIIVEIPRSNKNIKVITYKKTKQNMCKTNKNIKKTEKNYGKATDTNTTDKNWTNENYGKATDTNTTEKNWSEVNYSKTIDTNTTDKNWSDGNQTDQEITPENTTKCSSVTYGWNIDSTVSTGEFIYDSYVGSPYNETQTPLRPKILYPNLNITPQAPSADIYQKIIKYGWTYNRPLSMTSFNDSEPYKLCYENSSIKSLDSETPLTENVKKKKGISSFIKISSRFSFFKRFSGKQSIEKCASCIDLNSNVKYEKISKSANTI